jgi:hypothetical protein
MDCTWIHGAGFGPLPTGPTKLYNLLFIIEMNPAGQGDRMDKKVHIKLDKNGDLTLREVLKKIEEIQAQHPDLDVFFDGDEYAISSRPRKPEKH